ncbi:Alpha-1-acid glycoprotein [Myotis brandtii]|uniref:Alpha-1-acid glycoprotein n=1 Tax=Myotis brandtii TaxID=109478 RepID=S7NHU1_MYOBR|nr:Alpha-1-acid glycoprotein [Myotis brandtii]
MALAWALAVLSLLPLLDAQSPACPNFSVPITNASLDQVGAWALSAMGAVSLSGLPFPWGLAVSLFWVLG